MKKFLIFISMCVLSLNISEARDYAKLQVKEMRHAQKYATTKKVLQNQNYQFTPVVKANINIKDPHILKLGNYDVISDKDYNNKLKADEKEYKEVKKVLSKTASKHYKTQADSADFYKVYRVAEKIIRANKLDFINWRIEIYKDSVMPNAFTTNTNYIAISTSLLDNFADNEDALALIIGHEMGHALLGHQERSFRAANWLEKYKKEFNANRDILFSIYYLGYRQKYRIDAKNMEYAADIEGAKLAMHAGYSLDSGSDVMSYYSSLPRKADWRTDHPNPVKRLENLMQNAKYFPKDWAELGKYNIYNSEVLSARLSSDRKSMVISASVSKPGIQNYYAPETMEEVFLRLAYMSYINGEFVKSLHYFDDLFNQNRSNAIAYLYASYASECMYKNTGDEKYLKLAKDYIQNAHNLDSNNIYIKEQVDALQGFKENI